MISYHKSGYLTYEKISLVVTKFSAVFPYLTFLTFFYFDSFFFFLNFSVFFCFF